MDTDRRRLQQELETLSRIKLEIEEQDTLILEYSRRMPMSAVSEAQIHVLVEIFAEANRVHPALVQPFNRNDDPDALRPQLRSARAKVEGRIKALQDRLKQETPDSEGGQVSPHNRRRVFVVHGRNLEARDALFCFLRAINLDPIEWEEAVAHSAPYIGDILDQAFADAQAAIVLLTGDDMVRLGYRHLNDSDALEEWRPTAQARPNVLFEAGLAFGRHPNRTVIVAVGPTRSFSDIVGRHIIHLSNTPECRVKLAGRLKNAGCDVRTDNKEGWLREGDFDAANYDPDERYPNVQARPTEEGRAASGKSPGAEQATTKPQTLESSQRSHQAHSNAFQFDPERKQLVLKWPEGISLQIDWSASGTYGFVMCVINDMPDYMASYQIEVAEANSWNTAHQTFLPNRSFDRRIVHSGKNLEPIHKTNNQWLVRVLKQNDSERLAIGNDERNQLVWPNNDATTIEIWRLTLAAAFEAQPNSKGGLKGLPPTYLVVRWDRENNTMQMMKYDRSNDD